MNKKMRRSRRRRGAWKHPEHLEPRLMLAAWQNSAQSRDVNDDLSVSPIDALIGINRLNEIGSTSLGTREPDSDLPFYDVSGDDEHSPLDVLIVINALNEQAPVVAGRLTNDTAPGGATNRDRVTRDPSFTIAVSLADDPALRAGFADTPVNEFVDFQTSGGEVNRSVLETINGGPLADGEHTLQVQATSGSLISEIKSFSFTLDTTAPVPPTGLGIDAASDSGPSNSDGVTNDNTPTFTADADSGSLVRLFVDDQETASETANSPVSLTVDALADGNYSVHAIAEDTAGNVSDPTTAINVIIDTVSPSVANGPSGTLRNTFSSLPVFFDDLMASAAFNTTSYNLNVVGGTNDGHRIDILSAAAPDSDTSVLSFAETLPDQGYRFTVDPTITDLAGNPLIGPTSFDFTMADPPGIRVVSPADGEEMVNVTRETIIRFDEPVDPATITAQSLSLIAAGAPVPGRIVVSSTERFATYFYDTALPASTEVRVTVDGDQIMGRDGFALDADGDNDPGGQLVADFRTLPLTRIPGTNVFGFVYDSYNVNPDGSNIPIVGATIRVDAFPEANAVTDEDGRFELVDMPAPEFFVHVDGSTATNAPSGFVYPNVGKPFHSVPGQTIQLEMSGEPFDVFLPPMALSDVQPLSATESTNVGFGDEGKAELQQMFPELDPAVWDQVQVAFAPGSAVDDQGNPATQAVIIPVPPDRIPAPLPPNLDPQLVISIQAPGATNFDIPAAVTFPNLDGLEPGEQSLIFSFDHDAGEFKVIGMGTVSEDGSVIVSDPDVGILAPGWHYTQPGSTDEGKVEDQPDSDGDGIPDAIDDDEQQNDDDGRTTFAAGLSIDGVFTPILVSAKFGFALPEVFGSGQPLLWEEEFRVPEKGIEFGISPSFTFTVPDFVARFVPEFEITLFDLIAKAGVVGQAKATVTIVGNGLDPVGKISGEIGANVSVTASAQISNSWLCRIPWGVGNFICRNWSIDVPLIGPPLVEVEVPYVFPVTPPVDFMESIGPVAEVFGGSELQISPQVFLREVSSARAHGEDGAVSNETLSTALGFGSDERVFYRYSLTNGLELTGHTSLEGVFSEVLPVDTGFVLYLYSPSTNTSEIIGGRSGPSGSTSSRAIGLTQFGGPDADGDGIPDLGEIVIGTDVRNGDTDGDGVSDSAEIEQGLDPLDDRGFPTGVIATLPLPGTGRSITVEGDLAYVATGAHGLAIVDGSRFDNPVMLGQIDLPGIATTDVGVDPNLQIAAVSTASGFRGADTTLHLVDVSDPMLPQLIHSVPIPSTGVGSTNVEVFDGVAYAGSTSSLTAIDLLTGSVIQSLNVPAAGLAREGTKLYAFDRALSVIDIATEGQATVVGRLDFVDISRPTAVFAANGVVYLGGAAGGTPNGLATVDVSDPSNPTLISGPDFFFDARGLALNGSGLALIGSEINGRGVGIYDISDPQNTNDFLLQIPAAFQQRSIAIAKGIAFVAAGGAGLHVINYLPFDNQGSAPTVAISSSATDVDADTPALQVLSGTTIPIRVDVTDDVQVRDVELLVDGQVTATDVSFPFDFATVMPASSENSSVSIAVRATDTGGNATLSDPFVVDVVPDTLPPAITSITPEDGSRIGQRFRTVRVSFSEGMAETTLTPANIELVATAAPDNPLLPTDVQIRAEGRTVQFTYDTHPPGEYQLTLHTDALTDRAENAVGGNDVVVDFSVLEATAVWVSPTGGFWDDADNWEAGRPPDVQDNVLIDVPSNVEIEHRTGETTIGSLSSRNRLKLAGGTLTAASTIKVENTVTLEGGSLVDATLSGGPGVPPAVLGASDTVTFDGVTLENDLQMADGGHLAVANGLNLIGKLGLAPLTVGFAEITGDSVTNNGTIEAVGGTLVIEDAANFASGALTGGVWRVGENGTLQVSGADVVTNAATIILDSLNSQFRSDQTTDALAGLMNNAIGGRLELLRGRDLDTVGSFNNSGVLVVGPGSMLTTTGGGDFEQSAAGETTLGISGLDILGTLNVSSTARLDGTLHLAFDGGFAPELATLQLLTFDSRNGQFDTIDGFPPSLSTRAVYNEKDLTILTGLSFDNATPLPFSDNFNDGTLGFGAQTQSTGAGRIRVTGEQDPRSGNAHVVMDAPGGDPSRNELIYQLDLTGASDVELNFYHKSSGGSSDTLPAMFTGSAPGNGVSISDDGITWHRILNLAPDTGGEYQQQTVDLRAAITAAGITGDNLAIKFQQSSDGTGGPSVRTLDDIRIAADAVGPRVSSITPAEPLVFDGNLTEIVVTFDEPLGADSANNAANWSLVGDGNDDRFDTADDLVIGVTPTLSAGNTVTLAVANGVPLPNDTYRLLIRGAATITDAGGSPLNDGLDELRFFDVFAPESSTNDTTGTASDTGLPVEGGDFETRQAIGNNEAGGGDLDVFRIEGKAGRLVRATVAGRPTPEVDVAYDLKLRLLDVTGLELAVADWAESGDAELVSRLPTDSVYFVEVSSANATPVIYDLAISSDGEVAGFPLIDGFESGPPLAPYWELRTTGAGAAIVTSEHDPAEGSFHLVADTDTATAPWLLVYQQSGEPNFALESLGLIQHVDYVAATPAAFAALTPAEIAGFDTIFVPRFVNDKSGLREDENDDGTSDLVEALAGVGTTGRAILTGLDADEAFNVVGQEQQFLRNALQWVRAGQTVGLVALTDATRWDWTPWAADLNGRVFAANDEEVAISASGHPVMSGLNEAGLSNWNSSIVNGEIPGFETLAVDSSEPAFAVALARGGAGETLAEVNRDPALVEAILAVDLSGQQNVELRLNARLLSDLAEVIGLPTQFTGSVNGTGVSVSDDGETWLRLFDPVGEGQLFTLDGESLVVDIDEFDAANGLELGPLFQIKFQQYGFGPAPYRGIALDDIQVIVDRTGPTIQGTDPPLPLDQPQVEIPRVPLGLVDLSQIDIFFAEAGRLDPAAAGNPANYELREIGADGSFGNGTGGGSDDLVIALTPQFDGERSVRLKVNRPLGVGHYRATVKSGVKDAEQNPLNDTDGDGTGSDFVVEFVVFQISPLQAEPSPTLSIANNVFFTMSADGAASVAPVLLAAIDQWSAAGLDDVSLERLRNVQVTVADLGGSYLGFAGGNRIWIDDDAAGYGWFVDQTPHDNAEFESARGNHLQAVRDSAAFDRIDLLTVLAHELGHILGLDHELEGLLDDVLATSERRLITPAHVDAVFSGPIVTGI